MAAADKRPPLRHKRVRDKWTCQYPFTDKDGVKRPGNGRKFRVGEPGKEQEIELFPSGVLCGLLHRTQRCLYKWEKEFNFPQSIYMYEDDGRTIRWYSRAQLKRIELLYNGVGRLAGKNRDKLAKFIKLVSSDTVWLADRPLAEREKDANAL